MPHVPNVNHDGSRVQAIRPYGGTVLQTSLPHDAEQQLMKALHGDDPAAPTWQQPGPRPETPARGARPGRRDGEAVLVDLGLAGSRPRACA